MTDELKPSVRIERIQIVGVDGADWTERKQHWKELTETTRRVLNDMRCLWLAEHIKAGDHVTVREWMAADTAWAKAKGNDRKSDRKTRGKRAYCPVKPWPSEISRAVYGQLTRLHPYIATRCITLAMNTEQKTLTKKAGVKSAYPGWMKILCGDDRLGGSCQPQPLFFDKSNGRLLYDEQHGWWRFAVRVERIPRDGKCGKNVVDVLKLKTGGRGLMKIRKTLEKIRDGEWAFKGSRVTVRDGKWYLLLCYQFPRPERPELDADKVAYLSPAADRPVHLWIDGWPLYLRRYGHEVAHARRQLLTQRWSRQGAYKVASSAKRGHGRKRVLKSLEPLRRRWLDMTKTWNGQLAADVVKVLEDRGIGTLVFYQPTGARRDTRFLGKAGKVPGRRDGTNWDWHQMKTLLERQCQEVGIKVTVIPLAGKKPRFFGAKSPQGGNGQVVTGDAVGARVK